MEPSTNENQYGNVNTVPNTEKKEEQNGDSMDELRPPEATQTQAQTQAQPQPQPPQTQPPQTQKQAPPVLPEKKGKPSIFTFAALSEIFNFGKKPTEQNPTEQNPTVSFGGKKHKGRSRAKKNKTKKNKTKKNKKTAKKK